MTKVCGQTSQDFPRGTELGKLLLWTQDALLWAQRGGEFLATRESRRGLFGETQALEKLDVNFCREVGEALSAPSPAGESGGEGGSEVSTWAGVSVALRERVRLEKPVACS